MLQMIQASPTLSLTLSLCGGRLNILCVFGWRRSATFDFSIRLSRWCFQSSVACLPRGSRDADADSWWESWWQRCRGQQVSLGTPSWVVNTAFGSFWQSEDGRGSDGLGCSRGELLQHIEACWIHPSLRRIPARWADSKTLHITSNGKSSQLKKQKQNKTWPPFYVVKYSSLWKKWTFHWKKGKLLIWQSHYTSGEYFFSKSKNIHRENTCAKFSFSPRHTDCFL